MYKLIKKIVSKLKKKFLRKIYFLPSNKLDLPDLNYFDNNSYELQEKLIKKFEKNNKSSSFITCKDLIMILKKKFKIYENFNFIDIGGENIDFYLELSKKFINVKYYLLNVKKINDIFIKLKNNYNYKNLFIIEDISEINTAELDFVNFGSSIGYIKKYDEFLKKIIFKSKYVMFSGTIMYESDNPIYIKDMIVKQVNVKNVVNYLYFFNKKYFYNKFYHNDYVLDFERINYTDNVNFNNFNKLLPKVNYLDFLFKKNSLS